ncbi:enterochelin esterase [Streptomyces justiciae]|uniref:Enterochelin esterase n=1 Tax=Streptomyces justiciae TaxID=2780140 RepID=A0ABU3M4E7_9ACTN|nr:enterochelin esterase [Streptomyces justiciae]MDT7845613.1 enterochelin esterase [Streptomyces justiciae]
MPAIPAPALRDPRHDIRPTRVTGPRVARLVAQLAGADDTRRTALTEAFWAEVESAGTPLVEELEDDPGHRAVTFLWRGHRATRQVLLCANRIGDREHLVDSLLDPVPGTDVWQLGLRLRADHRGSYRMAADISPKEPPAQPDELQQLLRSLTAHAAPDPLNPRSLPTRWSPVAASVFALPHAPAQPWAEPRPAVPTGRVERHRVPAMSLGGDRDTWVYLPPGHGTGGGGEQPLPVVVLSDGDMWFGRLGFGRTLDALIAEGALPPLAVLAPDAVDRHTRWRELGARDAFVTFLADELLPWAAGRFPLTTDPRRTVMAGQSLGAITALHAGYLRPERFGRILAQSPSLWWRPGLPALSGPKPPVFGTPWLVSRFTCAERRPLTVHLDVGLHEGTMVDHSRLLYDALRAKGCPVTYDEFNGGHDYACWRGALANGLVRLLGA